MLLSPHVRARLTSAQKATPRETAAKNRMEDSGDESDEVLIEGAARGTPRKTSTGTLRCSLRLACADFSQLFTRRPSSGPSKRTARTSLTTCRTTPLPLSPPTTQL